MAVRGWGSLGWVDVFDERSFGEFCERGMRSARSADSGGLAVQPLAGGGAPQIFFVK